ncbi:MAG: DUF4886 domain-containing protein [Bacteroidetes bacterium]|nr:DUF4886 domain-containing protein [Bacteroidota bacterium]
MRNVFKLITALFCSSPYVDAQIIEPTPLNILFVGNSYTHMNGMPFIFEKIAKAKGKKVHVEMNTQSGASFNVHTTRLDLFETIKHKKWDFVVIQGYSREMSYDSTHIDSASVPYIQQILDSIYLNNPCSNVMFHMTWGYKMGFIERPEIDSYEKMSNAIASGYEYLGKKFNLPVIPVGRVWMEVRKKYPEIEMYDADLAHPSKNGSYTSACTFYSAIFKESAVGAFTSTISSKFGENIQKTAAEYVLKNYDSFHLSKNTMRINAVRTVEGKFFIEGFSNFPEATAVEWHFGDGKSSLELSPNHTYKKAGKYVITCQVTDTCGVRNYIRNVEFKEIPKPIKKPVAKPKKGNTPIKKI